MIIPNKGRIPMIPPKLTILLTKDRFTEWVVDVMGGDVRQRFRTRVPLMSPI